MSRSPVRSLLEKRAFDQRPPVDALYQYHVPFDDLLPGRQVESELLALALARGRVGLVGASGTGKSSVASAAFGPLVQGVLLNRRPSLAHMYRKLYTFAHRLWYGEVVTKTRRPEVLTTSAARSQLTSIVADFRRDGPDAEPVVFGSHRKAEAALIPIAMLEKLLPLVEDIVAVEKAKARYEHDTGERLDFNQLVTAVGFDPADFD
jgi:antitoxin StbD